MSTTKALNASLESSSLSRISRSQNESYYKAALPGVQMMWNNQFNEAESLYTEKINTTKNPRYKMHFAETRVIQYYITADSEDLEVALKRMESAKDGASDYSENS